MRSLVVAIGLLAFAATADAKPRRAKHASSTRIDKSKGKRKANGKAKAQANGKHKRTHAKRDARGKSPKRVAVIARKTRVELRAPETAQSIGACWRGRLQNAVQLPDGDGWFLRRPWRAYGTRSTIDHVERVLADVADRFPDVHDIAIGDISAEQGGFISDHSSHQSGRDVDVGLIFLTKPPSYPEWFAIGTATNLDLEALFVLVEEFARTAEHPDGVHMIFLDFEIQGLLYQWGLENGEDLDYLAKLFQYPHGRGQSMGIIRHEPNHADHLHVRFRCPTGDPVCR